MRYPRNSLKSQRNTAMKVSSFLGFAQEKIQFILNNVELSEQSKELAMIFDLVPFRRFISMPASTGRPRSCRVSILKAFIAKAAMKITENKKLREILSGNEELHKICGWSEKEDIPSLPTFSRVFNEFAEMRVAENIHEYLVMLAVKDNIIGHISRDATAVPARERFKKTKKEKVPVKRGRPKKGTPTKPKKTRRIEIQKNQELDEMINDLPVLCDSGNKINSQGNPDYWIGYKLHTDWSDEGIPVSYIITSASVHDSQVSIPLTLMSTKRATYLYELMDAGYDVPEIAEISSSNGHVSVIMPNNRRCKIKRELDPAKKKRYRESSRL